MLVLNDVIDEVKLCCINYRSFSQASSPQNRTTSAEYDVLPPIYHSHCLLPSFAVHGLLSPCQVNKGNIVTSQDTDVTKKDGHWAERSLNGSNMPIIVDTEEQVYYSDTSHDKYLTSGNDSSLTVDPLSKVHHDKTISNSIDQKILSLQSDALNNTFNRLKMPIITSTKNYIALSALQTTRKDEHIQNGIMKQKDTKQTKHGTRSISVTSMDLFSVSGGKVNPGLRAHSTSHSPVLNKLKSEDYQRSANMLTVSGQKLNAMAVPPIASTSTSVQSHKKAKREKKTISDLNNGLMLNLSKEVQRLHRHLLL